MPTIQQLIRNARQPIENRKKSPALRGCPQRRGVCARVYVRLVRIRSWKRLGNSYNEIREEFSRHNKVKIHHLTLPGMKFMVSIGANPITFMWDEKQFLIGSEWSSIHWAGKSCKLKKHKVYAHIAARTEQQGQLPGQPQNYMSLLYE